LEGSDPVLEVLLATGAQCEGNMMLDDVDEAIGRRFLRDLDAVLQGEDLGVAVLLALAHLQSGDPMATGLE